MPMIRNILVILTLFIYESGFSIPMEITYSGRLTEKNGKPIEGPIDLEVKFYESEITSTPIDLGKEITFPGTALNYGVFHISIELSDLLFNAIFPATEGSESWIEITDLTNEVTYPRQKYTTTPYALKIPIFTDEFVYNDFGQLELNFISMEKITDLDTALEAPVEDSRLSETVTKLGQTIESGEISGTIANDKLTSDVSLLGQTIDTNEIENGTLKLEDLNPACNDGEVLRQVAGAWACSPDMATTADMTAAVNAKVEDTIADGVTDKAPSQNSVNDQLANKLDINVVGTLTNNKLCTSDGSSISCTKDDPILSYNSNVLCKGDGSSVDCSSGITDTSDTTAITIDASENVRIGSGSPGAKLDVDGDIKLGNSSVTCDANAKGNIRFMDTTDLERVQVCNGSKWLGNSITAPSFNNSWEDYGGGYRGAGYYKDLSGRVHIMGAIKNGTVGAIAFTLPVGYRPLGHLIFWVIDGAPGGCRVDVQSTGAVVIDSGCNNTIVNLNSISFVGEQ